MNASDPGEIRVAILEGGELAEIFIERQSHKQQTGNIYKGRVVNIEPSLQAAFVDLGAERNGFLHISDCVHPDGGYTEILRPDEYKKKQALALERKDSKQNLPAETALESDRDVDRFDEYEAVDDCSENGPNGNGEELDTQPALRRELKFQTKRVVMGSAEQNLIPPDVAPMLKPKTDAAGPIEDKEELRNTEIEPLVEATTGLEEESSAFSSQKEHFSSPGEDAQVDLTPLAEDLSDSTELHRSAEEFVDSSEGQDSFPDEEEMLKPDEAAADRAAPKGRFSQKRRPGRRSRDGSFNKRAPIQEVLKKGQDVLVQVSKEGLGQKGPALTTYLSIPGRYLVLMPSVHRLGVSKRIDSEERRRSIKDILSSLDVPNGMGVIVRTAGSDCTREKLEQDLKYLLHRWEVLKKKAQAVPSPTMVFQEGDVVTRIFRDVFTDDVSEVVIDDEVVLNRAKEFLKEIAPGAESKIRRYSGHQPLFHRYGVEPQIQKVFNRKVSMKSGGSIVIEQTEAMVAIDVNTGRFRDKENQDDTILATNLEAARTIARELRLRDIGGLVMIDFIDMEIEDHKRLVEKEFRANLARDKARINMLPISDLGIVEMTRQRVRHSVRRTLFKRCLYCEGTGQLKSVETMGLEILRELRAVFSAGNFERGRVSLHPTVALDILNAMRRMLTKLEETNGRPIEVHADSTLSLSQWRVSVAKANLDWVHSKEGGVDDYVRNS